MPTQITQIDDSERGITIFRVDGEMFREDAELVGKIARSTQAANGNSIAIDLADLDFLDSESAAVLKTLEQVDGFEITGTEIFLQTVVDAAEGHPHRT